MTTSMEQERFTSGTSSDNQVLACDHPRGNDMKSCDTFAPRTVKNGQSPSSSPNGSNLEWLKVPIWGRDIPDKVMPESERFEIHEGILLSDRLRDPCSTTATNTPNTLTVNRREDQYFNGSITIPEPIEDKEFVNFSRATTHHSQEEDLITPIQNLINFEVEGGMVDFHLKDPRGHQTMKSHSNASHKDVPRPPHTTHPMLQQSDNISTGSEVTWQDWQTANNSYCTNSVSRSPSNSFEGGSEEACPQPLVIPAGVSGNKKTQYHKTKLCPWHRDGKCFMGSSCNYAHTRVELKPKPDLSKTKLCPEVVKGKVCERAGCRFAHDFVELRATSTFFKTRICKFWQRGFCPAGEDCRHAHGKEDLRCYPTSQSGDEYCSSGGRSSLAPQAPSEVGGNAVAAPMYAPTNGARVAPGLRRPAIKGTVSKPSTGHRAPAAATLPSPSFLSTSASTPCAAAYLQLQDHSPTLNGTSTNLALFLQQLADTLPGEEQTDNPTGPTLNVLKDWISQEVERQWISRAAQTCFSPIDSSKCCSPTNFGSPTSQQSFEEAMLLPQSVWKGLQGQSPMQRADWKEKADSHYDCPDSPSFADAIKKLLKNPSPPIANCEPLFPANYLREALGGMSKVSTGVWPSERPPVCKAPFS